MSTSIMSCLTKYHHIVPANVSVTPFPVKRCPTFALTFLGPDYGVGTVGRVSSNRFHNVHRYCMHSLVNCVPIRLLAYLPSSPDSAPCLSSFVTRRVPCCLDYDGGDCCQCTCDPTKSDNDDACGRWAGFACIDPMAPCVDDDSVTVDMIDICSAGSIGETRAIYTPSSCTSKYCQFRRGASKSVPRANHRTLLQGERMITRHIIRLTPHG